MASEIKVDTIVNAGGDNDTGIDLATNDQILLKVANATKLTMNSTGQTTIVGEGGTTTTSVQQGLNKCWINFDGSGTISTRDSFNVSGIVDDGVGKYTVNINNDMANDDYATLNYNSGSTNSSQSAFNNGFLGGNGNAVGSFKISSFTASFEDCDLVMAIVAGDLA